MATYILAYTVFLPYTIYYKNKGKIHEKQHRRIVNNKEKYKDKVLKEILNYMTRKDIPKAFTQKYRSEECSEKEYLIYKDERSDWGDIFGDFHLKDFISIWSYGKKHNKKAMKYYNACKAYKQNIEHSWFMDEIEKYFRKFKDIQVERGSQKIWGSRYDYILLKVR